MRQKQRESRTKTLQTTDERSRLMARVRQKGTAPELIVRDILKRQRQVFSANGRALPGSPDVYSSRKMLAVFVHGCFWHRHSRCKGCTTPQTNSAFWREKFKQNLQRDLRKTRQLRRMGYRVMTVWECQVKSPVKLLRLERRLERFFDRAE
jgi:DNA mismatch endonuclease, patch repair protein